MKNLPKEPQSLSMPEQCYNTHCKNIPPTLVFNNFYDFMLPKVLKFANYAEAVLI